MLLATLQRMQEHRIDRLFASSLAPGRHRCQGKAFLQGSKAADRQLLIFPRAGGLPGYFLSGELTDHTSRGAQGERTRRHNKSGSDKAGGTDERLLTHDDVVHDDRIDPDESRPLHRASVEHRPMPYVRVLFETDLLGREGMQDTVILDVGARPHDDAAHITPQRCPWPNVAAGADNDVSDERRPGVYERARVDDGDDSFE